MMQRRGGARGLLVSVSWLAFGCSGGAGAEPGGGAPPADGATDAYDGAAADQSADGGIDGPGSDAAEDLNQPDDGADGDAAETEPPPCGLERVREDLSIPTIDGHGLSAFLDRPAQSGCQLPTILLQTPYDKERAWTTYFGAERPARPLFDSPQYNYVVVDWRGSAGSQGLPHPGDAAWMAQDSYDTVEWIAAQSWSDGAVGLWGVSALCGAQYRTAVGPTRNAQHPNFADGPPPHLTAMVPIMCSIRLDYRTAYVGGVLRHEYATALDLLGFGVRQAFENNPRKNWLWDLLDNTVPPDRIRVPALVVSGWWDLEPNLTVDAFRELLTASDPSVRDQHRLLIGPWIHFATGGAIGEGAARPLTEAERAYMDFDRRIDRDSLAFFDHHLRQRQNEVTGWAPVRYHHENEGWREAQTWPPPGGSTRVLYFDAQSRLVEEAPAAGSLVLPYDPSNPSPSIGCATISPYACVGEPDPAACTQAADPARILLHGPLSQAALLERQDQITFQTEPLAAPLVLLGELRLRVTLSTDAADVDVAARILDVDPAGDPRLIGEGIQRLSARDSDRTYSEVTPGQRYSITVSLIKDFAHTVPVGHRLGVMLSGSHWPLFARNPGDGAVFVRADTAPGTNETFSYGFPVQTVRLKGTATPGTTTVYLDGTSRLEFGTTGEPLGRCTLASPVPPGYYERTLQHGGLDRVYTFYVPASARDTTQPLPVVLAIHGGYGTAEGMKDYTGFNDLAERERFVVVYPEGWNRAWNGGDCCGLPQREQIDDVGFIEAVIDAVEAETCVDPRRIYATGMSNGSIMSHRLACESDRIAAIAGVSGQLGDSFLTQCNPSRRVPVLHIHGTDDRCAVYNGGVTAGGCVKGPPPPAMSASLDDMATLPWLLWAAQLELCDVSDPPVSDPSHPPTGMWCLGNMPYVEELRHSFDPVAHTLDHWLTHNGCAPTPHVTTIGAVEVERYDCEAPGAVEFYRIEGGGHSWPGRQKSDCCEPNRAANMDVQANELIWQFFVDKRL